jgi:hypothetical protein
MSSPPPPQAACGGPSRTIKLIISLVILFHCSAILFNVLAGGGPFVMREVAGYYRPYLVFFWLTNGYRFYAPDPGPTDVVWYHVHFEDGTVAWKVVPRREDYYLRMPFQRHMSISMLAMMTTRWVETPATEDAAAGASIMARSRGTPREVLSPAGEVYFRSYARFVARALPSSPVSGSPIAAIDIFRVHYGIRTPSQVRMHYDMYDPRLLDISQVGTYAPDGAVVSDQHGFLPRVADDFFIELVQNEIVPLLERNEQLPTAQRRGVSDILKEQGIPYPLILPILRLPEPEQRQFFAKPIDRDTLRERYKQAVTRFDHSIGTPTPEHRTEPVPTTPAGSKSSPSTSGAPSRSVQ